eukprot:4335863-Prymnesium_polylepis.1
MILFAVVVAIQQRPADGVADEIASRLLVVEITTAAHHLCPVRAGLRVSAHQDGDSRHVRSGQGRRSPLPCHQGPALTWLRVARRC